MQATKTALITGVTGQDGSYLAEFLLGKGYEVHGLVRRVAAEREAERFSRITHLLAENKIQLHYGDATDYPTLWRLVSQVKPDEIYHLASQSNAVISWEEDFGAFEVNSASTHYLLSAIKELRPECRFFFAASVEMYGAPQVSPQDETTPFSPATPYSIAKTAGFYLTKIFREKYGLFASSGILSSHESPRRGFDFLTRKVTRGAARIKAGLDRELFLGNLESKKDWGFSGDFVRAMWLMLQQEKADDYAIGVGEQHTVKEFVEKTFGLLGLDWQQYVKKDERFFRPAPAIDVVSNAQKARDVLGWQPEVSFDDLVKMMVENDMRAVEPK